MQIPVPLFQMLILLVTVEPIVQFEIVRFVLLNLCAVTTPGLNSLTTIFPAEVIFHKADVKLSPFVRVLLLTFPSWKFESGVPVFQ